MNRFGQLSFLLILVAFTICVEPSECFAPRPPPQRKVIVTGAAGRTGKLVFSSLLKHSKFYPTGLVRTEKSAKKLIKDVECGLENVWVCDVTKLDPDDEGSLPNGLKESDSMIICTSAVPKMRKRSLAKGLLKMPINVIRGKKAFDFRELNFYYAPGQYPEKVDYEGQIAQIELAKKLGIDHVVLISSMGGTNPEDFLNTLGRDKNGKGDGDILIWKRKAEKYLVESGLQYTIIHPGGLKDVAGGEMELNFDVDDNLMRTQTRRSISRCDVARLCVAALTVSNGQSSSFDCVNKEIPEGTKPRPTEVALKEFLESDPVYDYADDGTSLDYSMNI